MTPDKHRSPSLERSSLLGRCCLLRPFGAILRSTLLPPLNSYRVERSPNNVISNSRQVLNSTAANQHNRVLLKIVANPRDVRSHLYRISEANAGHLSKRRVGFLRRLSVNTRTDPALLWTRIQRRTGGLVLDLLPSLPDQLIQCRHVSSPLNLRATQTVVRKLKGVKSPLSPASVAN